MKVFVKSAFINTKIGQKLESDLHTDFVSFYNVYPRLVCRDAATGHENYIQGRSITSLTYYYNSINVFCKRVCKNIIIHNSHPFTTKHLSKIVNVSKTPFSIIVIYTE